MIHEMYLVGWLTWVLHIQRRSRPLITWVYRYTYRRFLPRYGCQLITKHCSWCWMFLTYDHLTMNNDQSCLTFTTTRLTNTVR